MMFLRKSWSSEVVVPLISRTQAEPDYALICVGLHYHNLRASGRSGLSLPRCRFLMFKDEGSSMATWDVARCRSQLCFDGGYVEYV